MRTHTSTFKNAISGINEFENKLTFVENGVTIELKNENLYNVTPETKGDILKSIMKEISITTDREIPKGIEINYQLGIKNGEEYEYINFGNYIVEEIEKNEDTENYTITAYDKMLYAMKDYEDIGISFPTTLREYINAICNKIGLSFASVNMTFANYDRIINNELYLTTDGKSLGYTFRDALDEIAQATGSIVCLNKNDEVEIRYPQETNETINENMLQAYNVEFGKKYGKINSIVLSRSGESDNVYLRDEQSVATDGLTEIKIIDNQIMNFNDRSDYLPDILEKLNGLEYHIVDYESTGVLYLEVGDLFTTEVFGVKYKCLLLNNKVKVTDGISENIYTEEPETTTTDYTKADKTDRKINQAYIIVDKQNKTIESVVQEVNENTNELNSVKIKQDSQEVAINILSTNIDENGNIIQVKTKKGFTLDDDGLNIYTDENSYNAQIDNTGTYYKDGDEIVAKTSKDGSILTNLSKKGQEKYSYNGTDYDFIAERIDNNGENGYAHFYNGDD